MQKCVSVSVLTSDQEQWFQCEILLDQHQDMSNGELFTNATKIAQSYIDYVGNEADESDTWDDNIHRCFKIKAGDVSSPRFIYIR
jgi:hypothetical protein